MPKRSFDRLSLCVFLSVLLFSMALCAQQAHTNPHKKPEPPTIHSDLMVIGDEVVREQWAASLDLVNAPVDQNQVEPGQCIRFAVLSTGDGRDQLLRAANISFELSFAGKTFLLTTAPAAALKRIKPEGGDFVSEALGVINIKNPMESMVSMAASQTPWCVPADAQDGTANVTARAILKDGKTIVLNPRSVAVKTFESARLQPAFKDMESFGAWMQTYHYRPNPAQLLPALRIVASNQGARSAFNTMSFFIAALEQSPAAAQDVLRHIPTETQETRIYSLPLLRMAGYDIKPLLNGFTDAVTGILQTMTLPDTLDATPDTTLPYKLDMLWATFFATGRIEPIKTLASMLAWREDYDKFTAIRNSGKKPELTDSIMRGVVYMAAGWSMNSLSRNDGLLADYIAALKAAPDTPARVKAELANLHTNPAFRKTQ